MQVDPPKPLTGATVIRCHRYVFVLSLGRARFGAPHSTVLPSMERHLHRLGRGHAPRLSPIFFAENQIQRPCTIFSGRWGFFFVLSFIFCFFLFYSKLEKKKRAATGHVTSAGLLRASLRWQSRLPVQSSSKLAHLPTFTALTQEARPTGQASIAQRPALCCLDFVIEHRKKENPRLDGTNLGQKQPLMAQNLECTLSSTP